MIRTFSIYSLIAAAGLVGAGMLQPLHAATPQDPAAIQAEGVVAPPPPAAPDDSAGLNESHIYIDDSFAAQDLMRQALRFESQHQSAQAIQKYQEAIDQYGTKLIAVNKDVYTTVANCVQQRLLAMPSVQQGAYDQAFGPQVQKLVTTLIQQRKPEELLQTCTHYFASTAAVQGLAQSADWLFERGSFAAASRLWQRLLTHPMAQDLRPLLLHHLALAEQLSGHPAESAKFQHQLETDFPDATGQVSGVSVPLADNLKTLLAQSDQVNWTSATLPPDEWPMFQGSPSCSLVPDVSAGAATRLWGFKYGEDRPTKLRRGQAAKRNGQVWFTGYGEAPQGDLLESFPVASGGDIFVHTGYSILVRSASGGAQRWAFPEQPPAADPHMTNFGFSGARLVAHHSCCVAGDTVFAVLLGGQAQPVRRGAMPPILLPTNRLVALARTRQPAGKQLLWEKSGAQIAHDLEKDFPKIQDGALVLVGAPVVTRQGLYVMAQAVDVGAFNQLYLLHLDPETGRTVWGCFLCSYSGGSYFVWNMTINCQPLLSIADDVVYIGTDHGADAAVDANDGHMIWLTINEGAKAVRTLDRTTNRTTSEGLRVFHFNPPLLAGDKLVTAEVSCQIRIYDRFTGSLVRTLDPRQLGNATMALGVVGNTLITLGSSICATDINTGAPVWPAFNPDAAYGKVAGRPFLAAQALYVPFEKGLLTFDSRRGVAVNFSAWPLDDRQRPGLPGNLLVTARQLIVANDAELVGYSNWQAALVAHQQAIAAHPDDPREHQILAELAFRTSHFDLAQEQMKKAVDLATAPAVKPDAELRAGLYHSNLSFGEQLLAQSDPALRDRSRFYYECSAAVAPDPESQAQWRLCLAELAQKQHRGAEAAALYDAVLADAALRLASFQRTDTTTPAGVMAENKMRDILKESGRAAVYQPYEDRATAALTQARTAPTAAAFQGVLDAFPNSRAALAAAADMAAFYQHAGDPAGQIRTLCWLYQRAALPEIGARGAAAQAAADLALAHAALQRFNMALHWLELSQRQFADQSVQYKGGSLSVRELGAQLRQEFPSYTANRWPTLPDAVANGQGTVIPLAPETVFGADGSPRPIAEGKLLAPIETAPEFRRPDVFFVTSAPGQVSMFEAATLARTPPGAKPAPQWTLDLNESGKPPCPVALLGCVGNLAVFAAGDSAIAVDLDQGTRQWITHFEASPEDQKRSTEQFISIRKLAAQQEGHPEFIDAEVRRAARLGMALGNPQFTSVRLLGARLFVILANRLSAYELATGKPAWSSPVALPDGLPSAVVANDDLIVVQTDSPDKAAVTFVAGDIHTGAWLGTRRLEEEHVTARLLSENGVLFVFSDQAASAYDLRGDPANPLWKNTELRGLRYPGVAALYRASLVVLNNNSELLCLSQDGGHARWAAAPQLLKDLTQTKGQWLALRSALDGDNVMLTCTQGCAAYNLDTGKLSWVAKLDSLTKPRFVDQAPADPYLILWTSGPLGSARSAARLLALDRRAAAGPICLDMPIYAHRIGPAGQEYQPTRQEDPNIHAWQVINNAILMERSDAPANEILALRPLAKPAP